MTRRSNKAESGVSLTGLIFILAICAAVGLVALQVVPSVTEFMAVKKAIVAAKAAGSTPAEIRSSFEKRAEVGYITSISGKDLDILPQDGSLEVSFAYEKRIPLIGPASLVIDYEGSTADTPRSRKSPAP